MFKVFRPVKIFVNNLNYLNGFGVLVRFILYNIVDTRRQIIHRGSKIFADVIATGTVLWEH